MLKKNNREESQEVLPSESESSSLKIKLQDGKACEKILTIEVAQDRIAQEFESFYKAIAPRAKVPGFRPGKVPRDVLVMHYEKNANDSVLETLLSESLPKALREKDRTLLRRLRSRIFNSRRKNSLIKRTLKPAPRSNFPK